MLKKPFLIACSLIFCVLSCSAQSIAPTQTLTIGKSRFHIALAQTHKERARGLMEVKDLKADEGMLFVFPKPQRLTFWMKNTPLPLSIAYISAQGEIKEIYNMFPFSLDGVLSRCAVLYALEVLQGVFKEKGIQVGDFVEGLPSPSNE